jgi:hypothetical protein
MEPDLEGDGAGVVPRRLRKGGGHAVAGARRAARPRAEREHGHLLRREALTREHAFHAVEVAQQAGPAERTDDLATGLRRRELSDVRGAGQPEPVVEEERDGEAVDIRAEFDRRRVEERRERGAARGRGGGAGLRLLGLAGRGEAEDDGGLGRSKGDVREFALVVRAGEPERRVAERIEQCGEQRGRVCVALVDGGDLDRRRRRLEHVLVQRERPIH